MTTDPVCGMTIEPKKAAGSTTYQDQTYWFCSPGCLSKFKADPAKYAGGKSGARSGGLISSLLKKLKG
ncbi:MAG TPA: YHS domain-containing protein [Burkholderiaceae bacterium]|nr:YHS domain-containing protein [Burkholderiaceae bacterium]